MLQNSILLPNRIYWSYSPRCLNIAVLCGDMLVASCSASPAARHYGLSFCRHTRNSRSVVTLILFCDFLFLHPRRRNRKYRVSSFKRNFRRDHTQCTCMCCANISRPSGHCHYFVIKGQFLGDLNNSLFLCVVVRNHLQASKGKMYEHEFESILFIWFCHVCFFFLFTFGL